MKNVIVFFLGIAILSIGACAKKIDIEEDEVAIRKVLEQINAAFQNHDAEGMAALWDQSVESWNGSRKGAAQVKYYADLFNLQPSIKSNHLEEIGIIFVTPDVAIYKALMDNTGLVDKEGKPRPQVKWLGAWVFNKKNGKWLNAAFFSRPIEE
ncbi:unnamed protein product [marine sediment metagenome]|uniref:DUF4440 domain-containing protein n=1 Tax=marine sediment metagenome TaxID=412755 RepID=X1NB04_9ZZZZ